MKLPAALLALLPALALAGPARTQDDRLEFGKDILPLLKSHCLACHTHGKAKSELRLDTVELMMKGGENGPALVKGDSAKSLISQVVSGQHELSMPPKKNTVGAVPLKPEEIQRLKRWIDQGAPAARGPLVLNTEPPQWRPLPPGLNPINSVAASPDGQYAACGRANQIFVYSLPASGSLSARLVDPALPEGGVADHDLILSLAFSPDGTHLASGGYRSIRLWQRGPAPPSVTIRAEGAAAPAAAAASPDGKWLATGGPENTILLWDAATGIRTKSLAGHTGPVRGLSFSPDGTQLCSGSADKTLRLWTLADGQGAQVDAGDGVLAVAWALDGKRVAAGCEDHLIRLWTTPAAGAAWEKPRELKAHAGPVTSLSAVPPGKQILSGSEDGTVRLWNAESGKEERKMDHGAPVEAVAVQGDGKRWASAGGSFAKLWKNNGELQATIKGDRRAQEAQGASELTVAFFKEQIAYFKSTLQENEKVLAAESESARKAAEKALAVTRETAPKLEAARKAALEKPEIEKSAGGAALDQKKAQAARDAAAKAAPDLQKEAKAAAEKAAQAKAAAQKSAETLAAAEKAAAALTPETPADEAGKIREKAEASKKAMEQASASLAAAEKLFAEAGLAAKRAEEAAAAATRALSELAERQKDREARLKAAEKALADAAQAEQAQSAAEQNHERLIQVKKGGEEAVLASKAALGGAEADLKTAEAALETARKAAADSEKPIRRVAFSADQKMLATAGLEPEVRTWSTESGKGGEDYGPLDGAPDSVLFLPGNRLLAGSGGRIGIWSRPSEWRLERTLGGGGAQSTLMDRVLALAYSPDGKFLASGGGIPSRAGELKIWNPADGSLVREIKEAHSDTVFGVAYSRDGRRLASGGADKLIKIFDPGTGTLVKLFEGHTQHVLGVAWKRSGRTLVSAGADKVAKVWDLVTGEQIRSIEGFRKEVTAVSYLEAPNEILLASGDGQLRTAKEDGNKVRGYQFGKEYIESAAATADGRLIVAGGSDSVLRVFESGKDKLLAGFDPP
jgi:WD40 repeat protein